MSSPSKLLISKIEKYKKISLKNYKSLKKELKQPEIRLMTLLNTLSIIKIIFLAIVYKYWIHLTIIGFNNVYGVFSFISPDEALRQIVNEYGLQIFNTLLIILIIYMIIKVCVFSAINNDDYFLLIDPIKKILSSILRLGTFFLLVALYNNEVFYSEIKTLLMYILFFFINFSILSLFEKLTYKKIRKNILNDLVEKEHTLYTEYGTLLDIPLLVLKKESKWNPYIVRSKMFQNNIVNDYNKNINDCFKTTEAFMRNEKVTLNRLLMNYEFDVNDVTTNLYTKKEDENVLEFS